VSKGQRLLSGGILLVWAALSLGPADAPGARPFEHGVGIEDSIPTLARRIWWRSGKKILYLTLDACGGKNGSEIDEKLVEYLRKRRIRTTLFVSCRFLQDGKNEKLIKKLSKSRNFSIQNHGKNHRPALVSGETVYGIGGTDSEEGLLEEVEGCARVLAAVTGRRPRWYRSGTAHYDRRALEIINSLGHRVAGFRLGLDDGATLASALVRDRMLSAQDGDILLAHVNAPRSGTRDGLIQALEVLRKNRRVKFKILPR
jgi:peptidoglycan/xylan/chitin deacetylase (PgdA/CDA1 family)